MNDVDACGCPVKNLTPGCEVLVALNCWLSNNVFKVNLTS